MAYTFGDGFDCYAATGDVTAGYWDSSAGVLGGLVAGRFSGSQAVSFTNSNSSLAKSSGVNDAVHHIVCAFRQTVGLSGSTLGCYFQFSDGATGQCCIVFRSDGVILLTSATPGGTVLATYTGAVTAVNTWFAFEFEVVISGASGSFTARKNGNASADFTAGSLNTKPGANPYANKLTVGMNAAVSAQQIDDVLWRSDASSVGWVGDVRCYTRMPATDVQAQFARSAATGSQTTVSASLGIANLLNQARYTPFTAAYDGTIASGTFTPQTAGYTGNLKIALFASTGGAPGAVLASATPVSNPVTGTNTFTFPTPGTVLKGTQYWLGFAADSTTGALLGVNSVGVTSNVTYAAFPVASPTVTTNQSAPGGTVTITISTNNCLVNEPQQDGSASYVFDANIGDSDLYTIAALPGTPTSVIAVTTRGYIQKSDAGTRSACVQLKSGGTTVQSASTALSTSFGWLWRTDTTDPNGGGPLTVAAVNNMQIGCVVTA